MFDLVEQQPSAKPKKHSDADLFEFAKSVHGMKKTDARDWVRVNANTTDARARQIVGDMIIKGFLNANPDKAGRGFVLELTTTPIQESDEATPF
jgi:hypothetical protein